ncbi:TIR domain-containing protein [Roseovarius halotolerans]|uniref:toll/interleukin-1 receptor domain-containing protein n=1 Tax=Roseovarius halotolerans TaxID=505353 RepID=UPI000A26895E|nr:toll/interleukin-1 receptor domain-containing protein [Roseovarius halotolerans]RKT34728.1 TIR domain-containing protein [Roseovarius halotolerans]
MIVYTTKEEFRQFSNELPLNERTELRKRAQARSPEGATFLSRSSKDEDLVVGAIRVLENHGATVYIDKKDPELPPYTSEQTALTLKRRIEQTRKFVLLATENSKESKWVPWELGIADGKKGLSRIALFPAVNERYDNSWTTWEYMGLYHRIVWGDLEGYEKRLWMVLDETRNTAIPLSRWLNG